MTMIDFSACKRAHELLEKCHEHMAAGHELSVTQMAEYNTVADFCRNMTMDSFWGQYHEAVRVGVSHTLDEATAAAWVKSMPMADGKHWTVAETTPVAKSMGIECPDWAWNATMNMVKSDYYKADRTAQDYADLAKQFLMDKDGGGAMAKLSKYYNGVVMS